MGTYAEIIRKEFPQFEIIPEVWYTKNNKRGKIRYLSDFSASDLQLDRAKSVINNIVNINSEDDLPVMASNYKTCEFCNLCTDYMDLIFKPEKKEESKNSLFKFL